MTDSTFEVFECSAFRARLSRVSCAMRHAHAQETSMQTRSAGQVKGYLRTCRSCEIGAAHARGERPDIELVQLTRKQAERAVVPPVLAPIPAAPPKRRATKTTAAPPPMETAPEQPAEEPELETEQKPPKELMMLTYRDRSMSLADWCRTPEVKALGITTETLRERLRLNWTPERALTQPKGSHGGARRGAGKKPATPKQAGTSSWSGELAKKLADDAIATAFHDLQSVEAANSAANVGAILQALGFDVVTVGVVPLGEVLLVRKAVG